MLSHSQPGPRLSRVAAGPRPRIRVPAWHLQRHASQCGADSWCSHKQPVDKGLFSPATLPPQPSEAVFVPGYFGQGSQTEGPHQILEYRSGRQGQTNRRKRWKGTRGGKNKQAFEPRVSQGGDGEGASCHRFSWAALFKWSIPRMKLALKTFIIQNARYS